MTKLLMALTLMIVGAASAMAISLPFDKYTINRSELPQDAQEMLEEHFPKAKVSMIKIDKHLLKKPDYDVKLTNGIRIAFNSKGQWKSVESGKRELPLSLLHKTARTHFSKKFPDAKILSVKKDLSGFDIVLEDGRNIKYDRLGIFKGES
ncbi:MAG: PepSY-like domain-containing protein [Muribaculaceae bacterium]|nr:PepSY-like domain-containing protein [Muribaculaceae bacterium]